MQRTRRDEALEHLSTLLRTQSVAAATLCLLIWLNIFAPDAALLTSKYTVSIPGANADASYPVFLAVATVLLSGIHVYNIIMSERFSNLSRNMVRKRDPLFRSRSRLVYFAFHLCAPFLGLVTLAGATWKAMAVPAIGIPIALLTIGVVLWTLWRSVRRGLRRRGLQARWYWTASACACGLLAWISFIAFAPQLIRPLNLFRADLSDAYLVGLSLSNANMRSANLRGAILANTDASGADLRGANLEGSTIDNVVMVDATMRRANLRNANITQSVFGRTDAELADFSDATIKGTVFAGVKLDGATFTGSNVECSSFQVSSESMSDALQTVSCWNTFCDDTSQIALLDDDGFFSSDCLAAGADSLLPAIDGAAESNTSFTDARVDKVVFDRANISGVSFQNADLTGTRFLNSYLANSWFGSSDSVGALFFRDRIFDTSFAGADLSGAFFRRTLAAGLNFAEANVSGMTVSGSRIVMSHGQPDKAAPLTEEQAIEKIERSDNFAVRWRREFLNAMVDGASPIPSDTSGLIRCGHQVEQGEQSSETLSNCSRDDNVTGEVEARYLLMLACDDRSVVPEHWPSSGGDVINESVRKSYLNRAVERLIGWNEEEFFSDTAPTPPEWSPSLLPYLFSDKCDDTVLEWISPDSLGTLQAMSGK